MAAAGAEGRVLRQRSATGTRAAEPACRPVLEGPRSQESAAKHTVGLTRTQPKSSILGADRAYMGNAGSSPNTGNLRFLTFEKAHERALKGKGFPIRDQLK